jgi:hypothetical protein
MEAGLEVPLRYYELLDGTLKSGEQVVFDGESARLGPESKRDWEWSMLFALRSVALELGVPSAPVAGIVAKDDEGALLAVLYPRTSESLREVIQAEVLKTLGRKGRSSAQDEYELSQRIVRRAAFVIRVGNRLIKRAPVRMSIAALISQKGKKGTRF